MNRLKSAVIGIVMFMISTWAFGQQPRITMSNERPQHGERLTFYFTPEDRSKDYDASLYLFHSTGFHAADLDMQPVGTGYEGGFFLPDSVTAVLIGIAVKNGGLLTTCMLATSRSVVRMPQWHRFTMAWVSILPVLRVMQPKVGKC